MQYYSITFRLAGSILMKIWTHMAFFTAYSFLIEYCYERDWIISTPTFSTMGMLSTLLAFTLVFRTNVRRARARARH